jgi:hypothetical protein
MAIAEIAKKNFWGERVVVQISGQCISLMADQDAASLLLAHETLGRNAFFKIGGFNKVLYLRVE